MFCEMREKHQQNFGIYGWVLKNPNFIGV